MQGCGTRTYVHVALLESNLEKQEWGLGTVTQGGTDSHPRGISTELTSPGTGAQVGPSDCASELSSLVTKDRSIYPPASIPIRLRLAHGMETPLDIQVST